MVFCTHLLAVKKEREELRINKSQHFGTKRRTFAAGKRFNVFTVSAFTILPIALSSPASLMKKMFDFFAPNGFSVLLLLGSE